MPPHAEKGLPRRPRASERRKARARNICAFPFAAACCPPLSLQMIGRPQTHTTFSLLPLCGACPPALTQSIIPSLSLRLFPTPSSAPSPRSRSHHHHPQPPPPPPPPPPPLPRPGPGRGAGSAAARRGALGRGGWSYLCVRGSKRPRVPRRSSRGRRSRCGGIARPAPGARRDSARFGGEAGIPALPWRGSSVGFPAPIRRALDGSGGRAGAGGEG